MSRRPRQEKSLAQLPRHERTNAVALPLEEVQKLLANCRGSPFRLGADHGGSRVREVSMSRCLCCGVVAQETKSPCRLAFVVFALVEKEVTQSDFAAQATAPATTNLIHPRPWEIEFASLRAAGELWMSCIVD